ncbi:MAG: U6 snRNA-associated Sm-like protein LSm2 [Cercozoa sp. M6MM]
MLFECRGRLHSVDQYLNIKLTGVEVVDGEKYPHLAAVTSCFVRGSVVRYVQLPVTVDVQLLQDACRRSFRNTSEEDKPATAAA